MRRLNRLVILILHMFLVHLDLPLLLQLSAIVVSDSWWRVLDHGLLIIIMLSLLNLVLNLDRSIILLAKVLLVPPLPVFHGCLVVHVVISVLVDHVFVNIFLFVMVCVPLPSVIVHNLLKLVIDLVLHLVQLFLLHVVDVCFQLQILLQLLLLCYFLVVHQLLLLLLAIDLLFELLVVMLLHVHLSVSSLLLFPLEVFCLLFDHSTPFIDLSLLCDWVVSLLVLI